MGRRHDSREGLVLGEVLLLRLPHRLEHALVVLRHDLAKCRELLVPVGEESVGDRRPGFVAVTASRRRGGTRGPRRRAGRGRPSRSSRATGTRPSGRARTRCRRTCRRRSCVPCGRARRLGRRSCTRSRGHRRPRRRRSLPSCARRSARPPHPRMRRLAARRAVEDDVARDDVLLGDERSRRGRGRARDAHPRGPCRSSRSRRPRAASVMPRGTNAPKLCPAEPREVDGDGVVGQALAAVATGHLVAEHRADGAVDVADRQLERAPGVPSSSAPSQSWISVLSRARSSPWSCSATQSRDSPASISGTRRIGERSRPEAFQWSTAARGVEHLGVADRFGDRAEAEGGEVLAHLLGDVLEEVDDELRLAGEPLAQLGVLRGHTDRAGVEMADAHHHAAADDERRRRESELLGAEQRRDDDVAAGLQLAVDLHDDAIAQPVDEQRLLRLGEAELPRRARVLDRRERRSRRCRRRGRR